MPLPAEARDRILELAQPIADPPRREAFVAAVTERLEASPMAAPGTRPRSDVSCNRDTLSPSAHTAA
jgi:hypothetical protein